ncbi:MAG: hypothetical protein HZA79_15550 [Sphingobacteriales bacterium]|nr:hypothetical protein [Sphingobacteriales bacterium]
MKACWVVLGLVLCNFTLPAQQHLIRYDIAGEHVSYFKIRKPGDTVTVSVLPISKTNRVNLQLINAANSYQRRVTYINREETPEAIIIPGLGSNPAQNLVNGLAVIDPQLMNAADIFKKQENDNKMVDLEAETSQQKAAKLAFASRYNEFTAAISQWRNAVLFEQNCQALWKDLAGLRYSMQEPAAQVKRAAKEKTETVFPGAGENPSVILLNNNADNLKSAVTAVRNKFTALFQTYSSFSNLDIESPVADSLIKEAQGRTERVNVNTVTAKGPDAVVNRIAELFRQIQNDHYTQLTTLDISRKTIMAEIDFIPLIDSVTADALNMGQRDTIKRLVPIFKKEPLRFRNTFGFSFVSYAENRWHYYVTPDSLIARETADQFQPVVVTYLHFYAPRDRGFRWGGTFGAGVPVGGDNSKLNIMIGLSTYLGKNDPVCISAGLAGTQVKKLSGWKTGDKVSFSSLGSNDYSTVYRLGYFFALTFNPGNLNLKD